MSKFAVSELDFKIGAQGAFIFLPKSPSKLTFSNQGCYFIYLAPFTPILLAASLQSNFFNKSCNFGEN